MKYLGRQALCSIPDAERPDDPVPDQAGKLIRAGVEPTKVLVALAALAIRPGIARKPSVVQGRHAGLLTPERMGKEDDLKTDMLRVGEGEFVFALVAKAILFVCHAVVAPGAEPVTSRVARRCLGPRPQLWLGGSRRYQNFMRLR